MTSTIFREMQTRDEPRRRFDPERRTRDVRCRTCHSDHDFRHEQAPPPKVDPRKAALFNQVLETVTGAPAPPLADAPVAAEASAGAGEPATGAVEASEDGIKPKGRKKARG